MSISDNFPAPETDFPHEPDNEWGELLNAAEEQETETGEEGIFSRPPEEPLEAESGEAPPITPGKGMGEESGTEETWEEQRAPGRTGKNGMLGMSRDAKGKLLPKFSRPPDALPTPDDFLGDGEEPIPVRARKRAAKIQHALRLFLYGRNGRRGYTLTQAAREAGTHIQSVGNSVREDGIMAFKRELIHRKILSDREAAGVSQVHKVEGLPALLARYKEANSLISRLPITSKAFRDALSAEKALRLAIDALSGAGKTPIQASKQPAAPPPAPELPPPPPSWG